MVSRATCSECQNFVFLKKEIYSSTGYLIAKFIKTDWLGINAVIIS